MRLRDKIDIGYKILKIRFFNFRSPLVVSWAITNRCNLNCKYCFIPNNKVDELRLSEVFFIIDELKTLGTKIIFLTGGEPLLRGDIGKIISYINSKGIYVNMNTNGTLFLEKINELNGLNAVKFSLDGPIEVNDYVRGRGTFQKVIEAIEVAKNKSMKPMITTVLSKYNLDSVDYLVRLAEKLNILVDFQPVTTTLLGSNIINPHIPQKDDYKTTIERLINYKKNGKPIFNTVKGLIYFQDWPESKNSIFCYNRSINCRIEANGYLWYCGIEKNKDKALHCLKDGVKKAFDNLTPISCKYCWCAPRLEINNIFSLNLKAILSFLRNYKLLL
jgi:MoaA/NifB/PqqE/SkfB family radical SAM enzyme